MNKKFLVKDLSIKKKIINDYLKDLFKQNDVFVKLTALDFLSNYLHEDNLEDKLKDLYKKETNQSVIRAYEQIFTGEFESSTQRSKKKALELTDHDALKAENQELISSLNQQLKYYKSRI